MNPEFPQTPREEMEARITALLLEELSAEEAAAVRAAIAQDPGLAKLHARLEKTLGLVREAAATTSEPATPPAEPLKLSEARREKLLAHFKTITPPEFVSEKPRRKIRLMELAAVVAIIGLLAAISIPALKTFKMASRISSYDAAPVPPAPSEFVNPDLGGFPLNPGTQRADREAASITVNTIEQTVPRQAAESASEKAKAELLARINDDSLKSTLNFQGLDRNQSAPSESASKSARTQIALPAGGTGTELFDPAKSDFYGEKTLDRLQASGSGAGYDRYTQNRMLSQLGDDSKSESAGKMNIALPPATSDTFATVMDSEQTLALNATDSFGDAKAGRDNKPWNAHLSLRGFNNDYGVNKSEPNQNQWWDTSSKTPSKESGGNYFVGDPEWIGVLARPDDSKKSTDSFVSRYAYQVVPAGEKIDVAKIHEAAKAGNAFWGSYDGSTTPPIVNPNGTSIAELEQGLQANPKSRDSFGWEVGGRTSSGGTDLARVPTVTTTGGGQSEGKLNFQTRLYAGATAPLTTARVNAPVNQPVVDPNTGLPVPAPVIEPSTGLPYPTPMIDPTTGLPVPVVADATKSKATPAPQSGSTVNFANEAPRALLREGLTDRDRATKPASASPDDVAAFVPTAITGARPKSPAAARSAVQQDFFSPLAPPPVLPADVPSAITTADGHGTHIAGIIAGEGRDSVTVSGLPSANDFSNPASRKSSGYKITASDHETRALGIGVEGEFGRAKPDVLAPGTFVQSASEPQVATLPPAAGQGIVGTGGTQPSFAGGGGGRGPAPAKELPRGEFLGFDVNAPKPAATDGGKALALGDQPFVGKAYRSESVSESDRGRALGRNLQEARRVADPDSRAAIVQVEDSWNKPTTLDALVPSQKAANGVVQNRQSLPPATSDSLLTVVTEVNSPAPVPGDPTVLAEGVAKGENWAFKGAEANEKQLLAMKLPQLPADEPRATSFNRSVLPMLETAPSKDANGDYYFGTTPAAKPPESNVTSWSAITSGTTTLSVTNSATDRDGDGIVVGGGGAVDQKDFSYYVDLNRNGRYDTAGNLALGEGKSKPEQLLRRSTLDLAGAPAAPAVSEGFFVQTETVTNLVRNFTVDGSPATEAKDFVDVARYADTKKDSPIPSGGRGGGGSNVYSLSVVGYVDTKIPANKYQIVSTPLNGLVSTNFAAFEGQHQKQGNAQMGDGNVQAWSRGKLAEIALPNSVGVVTKRIDKNEVSEPMVADKREDIVSRYAALTDRKVILPANVAGADKVGKVAVDVSGLTPEQRQKELQAMDAAFALNGLSAIPMGDKYVKLVPSAQAGAAGAAITTITNSSRAFESAQKQFEQWKKGSDLITGGATVLKEELTAQEKRIQAAQTKVDALRKNLEISDYDAMGTSPTPSIDAETVRRLQGELIGKETQLARETSRLTNFSKLSPVQRRDAVQIAIGPDAELGSLLTEYNLTSTRLVALHQDLQTNSATYINIKNQLDAAAKKVDQRVEGILVGMSNRVEGLESETGAIKKKLEDARAADIAAAEKSRPYYVAKAKLDDEMRLRNMLNQKIAADTVDARLPRSMLVEVLDQAEPTKVKPTGPLAKLGSAFATGYEGTARVKIEREMTDVPGLTGQQNFAGYDPYFIQTEFEVIQSEDILRKVVNSLNLTKTWGKEKGVPQMSTQEAMGMLKGKLDVKPVKGTSIVEIGAKSDDPKEAALLANEIAKVYREHRREKGLELIQGGIAVLQAQSNKQDEKIRQARAEVERLRQQLDIEPDVVVRKPATNAPVPQAEIATAENNFSTFSLNVSDVSFKLAGASLEKGQMPEVASLRAEEFLNAFDYRDPEAAPGAAIAFNWERARYPFAHNRDLLRFSIKTAAAGRQAGRPLNIVLLLDNSGSMERSDRVSIIREALRVLAAQLQPQDKISVIMFARTARLVADGVSGDKAAELADQISDLTPQGGTNLEDAMNLAYQTAARHYAAHGINRVVLLTDGAANLGNVEPETLKQQVESQRKQGIALDCFGIGWEGFNDDLLEVLSRNGDGRYGFINSPIEAASEFAGQLAGALQVAASDVKVQVEFNPKRATAYRQIGYAKHQLKKEQFRDNTVDAAEIASQEAGNALYTVEVNPAGEGPICTVRVRYKIPGTRDYREQEWAVPYVGNPTPLETSSPAMRLAATSAAFAEWLVASPFAGEVTPDQLLNYLSGVPETYGVDTRPKKLEWMIRQAKSLEGK